MTAASELKSAAVVQEQAQQESRKQKTPVQTAVKAGCKAGSKAVSVEVMEVRNKASRHKAVKGKAAEQVQAANGSTTAGATQTVAAAHETSGSSAATASKAASMQATRLPVSVFSKNRESQLSSRIRYRCGFVCRGARRMRLIPQGDWAVKGESAPRAAKV